LWTTLETTAPQIHHKKTLLDEYPQKGKTVDLGFAYDRSICIYILMSKKEQNAGNQALPCVPKRVCTVVLVPNIKNQTGTN